VHLDRRQIGQHVRRVLQLEPVELDVLACGEVPVTPVVFARDACEHAHLRGAHQPVRHGDAQHIGMDLHVQTVLQTQDAELVFRQLARQAAAHLVAKLRDTLGGDPVIELVVAIHLIPSCLFLWRIRLGHR